jgi:hypothetical protein
MRQQDHFNRFQQFLNNAGSEFQILEHQVPIETQMEYFKYTTRLRELLPDDTEMAFEEFASVLFDANGLLDKKKQILSALAVSKEVKAYRMLQEYTQNPDKELIDWAHMAFMESRIAMESEFSDERMIYISTGLGGKGKKLRFYVLLLSNTGQPFLDYQLQVIEREFAYTLAKEDGEVEQLIFKQNYVEMLLLAPFHTNIKKVIEYIVSECNQYGDFISNTVALTNVKKFTDAEIAQLIKKNEKKGKNRRTSR